MAAKAPFKVGSAERFLPQFAISLHRTNYLPANYARFTVPLWFSKMDLRDYLYHVYSVRIHSVRSYVKQQAIQQANPKSTIRRERTIRRPLAKKYMTVELERPFVWPEEPEDLSPWNYDEVQDSEKDQDHLGKTIAPTADMLINEERRTTMREQARALLEGRQKWKPNTTRSLGQLGMLSR